VVAIAAAATSTIATTFLSAVPTSVSSTATGRALLELGV
jgi:hypothetical protein